MAKIYSEKHTRSQILKMAKRLGCDKDVLNIFNKYDKALSKCKNEEERKHIATCGAVELHKFFYCRGSLTLDGVEIIPAEGADNGIIKL